MVALSASIAVALTLGLAPVSSADPVGDKKRLDADIGELRTALEGTSEDLTQAFMDLHRTEAELPGARQALADADSALVVADRRNEAAIASLVGAEASATKAGNALRENARTAQEVQERLGNLARDEYQQGGVSGLSLALDASSPADFTNRMITMDTVMRVRSQTLRGLATVRAQGKAEEAHLVAVRQQVAVLKVRAGAALAQATAARRSVADAKSRLDQMYAAQTRFASKVAAQQAGEIARIGRMQAQSDALTRQLAARAEAARVAAAAAARGARNSSPGSGRSGGGQPGAGTGLLGHPSSAPVSSQFGQRFHPILRTWRLHAGIDFAAPCGSPVYAAAAGEVIIATPAGQSGGYGNRLVISHGLHGGVDLTTTYSHLTRFAVTRGRVAKGQVVAYSGSTGLSTGCHLHFETRANGTPVNPVPWL